jgi:hypothetical protein
MTRVTPYYSVNEDAKPEDERVYHTDNQCRVGREIPKNERCYGTGGYHPCKDCPSFP